MHDWFLLLDEMGFCCWEIGKLIFAHFHSRPWELLLNPCQPRASAKCCWGTGNSIYVCPSVMLFALAVPVKGKVLYS